MEYYERLKLLREKEELSQKELGLRLGFSQNALSQYESHERKLSAEAVIAFAKFFKVSTDYFLGLTDDPTPAKPSRQ